MQIGFSTQSESENGFVTRPLEPLPGIRRRPTYAEIDLGALRNNLQLVRQFAPHAKIMASVKAQAYGHGLLRVSEFLAAEGVDAFAVGFLEEGIWLRKAGIDKPILALGGVANDQIGYYLTYDIALACASIRIANVISETALRVGKKARVHLKLDTGMRRLGVFYDGARKFAETVAQLPGIEIDGVFSHFATSDVRNDEFAKLQLARFEEALAELKKIGIEPQFKHIANSGAIINLPDSHFDMVRPGLILYGYRPSPKADKRLSALQPVMTLKSEVLFVKGVRAGEGISYGLTYRPKANTWIATVPIGYGDGYNRQLSNRAQVLIDGKRYGVAGRICMDQMMVDLGKDRFEPGVEVVLFGTQTTPKGHYTIDAWELCKLLKTIPYELTCWVSERVPRLYKDVQ